MGVTIDLTDYCWNQYGCSSVASSMIYSRYANIFVLIDCENNNF